jgi:hypothetical protein
LYFISPRFIHVQFSHEFTSLFPSFRRESRHDSSFSSVWLCVRPHDIARKRLRKLFPAAKTKHATTEEMFGAVFTIWSVSYQIISMLRKQSRRLVLPRSYCNKSTVRDYCVLQSSYMSCVSAVSWFNQFSAQRHEIADSDWHDIGHNGSKMLETLSNTSLESLLRARTSTSFPRTISKHIHPFK